MKNKAAKLYRAVSGAGAMAALAVLGAPVPASAQQGLSPVPNYGNFNYGVCRGVNPACFNNWNPTRKNKLLLYTRTAGPRHAKLGPVLAAGLNPPLVAANVAQNAMIAWAAELGYGMDYTEDVTQMNNLSQYNAVIFLSTSRDALWNNPGTPGSVPNAIGTQQDAARTSLRNYMRAGGAFVGIHNAFGTEYNWPYYEGLLGNANYYDHGGQGNGTVVLQAPDPITAGLPSSFTFYGDEWYNLLPYPTQVKFLMTVDETSLPGGTAAVKGGSPGEGTFHPVAWCQYYDGGKVFVTTLGHDAKNFTDTSGVPGQQQFKQMIKQGIQAVTGQIPFCT